MPLSVPIMDRYKVLSLSLLKWEFKSHSIEFTI